jgi:hypothetical protein
MIMCKKNWHRDMKGIVGITDIVGVLVVCSAQQENDKFHQTAMKVMEKRCNE